MPWDFTKTNTQQGGVKWDFTKPAGVTALPPVVAKKGLLAGLAVSPQEAARMKATPTEAEKAVMLAQSFRTTAPAPMGYAAGQFAKELVAPYPVPQTAALPAASRGEQLAGVATSMAGRVLNPVWRALASIPGIKLAVRVGAQAVVREAQKVLGGEKVKPAEAVTNIGVSIAMGAASDYLAPVVQHSVATTLAKHFPESLPAGIEKAIPYILPVTTGATVGAARGTAQQIGKLIRGEPVSIGSAIADIGEEAAIMAVVNGVMAAVGLAPKGKSADYYKFAKTLIEMGSDEPGHVTEFPGAKGVWWSYEPKTATVRWQFATATDQTGQLIPSFLSQAGLATVPQGVAQPTSAAQAPSVTLPIPLTSLTRAQAVGEVVQRGAAPSAQAGLTTRPVQPISQVAPSPAPPVGQIAVPEAAAAAKEPWVMTREEYGASAEPNKLPPEYEALKAIADRGDGRPYNPNVITEEAVAVLRVQGLISGKKNLRITYPKGFSEFGEWSRLAEENRLARGNAEDQHYALVEQALSGGKSVSPEALRDYPELTAKHGKFVTPGTAATPPIVKEPWQMKHTEFAKWADKQTGHVTGGRARAFAVRALVVDLMYPEKTPAQRAARVVAAGVDDQIRAELTHEGLVAKAIRDGKVIPPEVLADYPDLAAKYAKPIVPRVTPAPMAQAAAPPPPAGRFPGAGRVSIVEPTAQKPPAVQAFAGTTPIVPKGKPAAVAQPVKRSDVVKFLSEKLGVPIRVGRYVGKAPGIFKVKPEVIRTRIANNLAVISHEVGHYLDKALGLDDPKFDAELQSLGKPAGPNLTGDALRREGTAEFVRLYLTDPDKARTGAPSYFAEFETRIGNDPQVRDTLLAARQQISDWTNQPAAARISAAISVGEKVNRPVTWDGLYTKLVDELRPLEKVVKELTGGEAIPITKDPFKLAWLARGSTGKAEAFLHHAVLDEDFKKIGDSLESILKPVRDNLEDVRRYITAKRALELEVRGKATGIDPADAKEFVDGHPELEKIQKALVEFQDEVLDQTLVRSGIISKTAADAMRKMNQEYVPFYRVFDESRVIGGPGGGKGYANLSNPVKRLKGSEREIIDPLESIIKNTYAYVTLAARNDVGKTLADLAEATEGGGKWVERVDNVVSEIAPPAAEVTDALESVGVDASKVDVAAASEIFTHGRTSAKENILRVFVDGEPRTYQVDPELYPVLLALDRESVDIFLRILSIPAQVLRAGAVLNPSFILRNPVRDQVDAYLFSKYGYKPFVDLPRGVFHVVKKDDLYWKWMAAGGAQSALVSMDRDYLQGTLDELLKTQAQEAEHYASHPIEVLRALSEWGEAGTRVGEFAKGVKVDPTTEGILEAALASRDVTVDFARRGGSPAVKWYRRLVPFFNATIQGTDKLRRAIRDNPKQFTIRALLGITLPTLATYLMCRKNNHYKELPPKEKDMYWHIPTGTDPDAVLLRIPKPHEAGIIFGSLPERMWAYIDDRDPNAFDELGTDILSEMLPSMVPQFLVGYFEGKANTRFYSGTPIIPAHEEDLPPEMQYGPYTPETLKWLGEQFKLSPRLMEHYISSYGGGLADTAMDAADWVFIQLTGIEPTPQATQGAAGIPGIGSFVTSTAMSQSVDELYNEYDRLTKEETRAQAKRQPMAATDRVKLARVKSGYNQMSGLQKRRRAIEDSRTMTPEVKKEQLEAVQRQMVEVARRALGKVSLNPGK